MVPQAGQDTLRMAMKFGITTGIVLLLSGCDSSTAPSRAAALNVAKSLSGTKDVAEYGVVVVGTGNSAVDVPAVQAAVDRGGVVILKGHFSFDATPNANNSLAPAFGAAYPPAAQVKITKAVVVSGVGAEDGNM